MKKFRLKISVLVLALSPLTNSYAQHGSPIPLASPGFSANLAALYLQPSANNLNYAVYTQPLPVPAPNWTQKLLKPGFTPAFDLGLQYNFADANNKVNVDWLYLKTNNSTSFSTNAPNTSVAPPYYFGPLAQALTGSYASTRAQFQVNNVGATLGRLILLSNNIIIDPFFGVGAANLKQDLISNYIGVDSNSKPYSITAYNNSKFTGIGPRLGLNATYYITNRWGVSARLSSTLLAGKMKSTANFSSYGAGNLAPTYTELANQSQVQIVPELDSKLELNYVYSMNGNKSTLSFSLGYLFSAYINGINQVVPTALVPGAFNGGVLAIESSGQSQSDLDLNGPYASLTWKF